VPLASESRSGPSDLAEGGAVQTRRPRDCSAYLDSHQPELIQPPRRSRSPHRCKLHVHDTLLLEAIDSARHHRRLDRGEPDLELSDSPEPLVIVAENLQDDRSLDATIMLATNLVSLMLHGKVCPFRVGRRAVASCAGATLCSGSGQHNRGVE
jgi:hypothetical protein